MIQYNMEKTDNNIRSCRRSKGGLYYKDSCHSCCSLYQNEQWEDSHVLVLLPLLFCSTLRGTFWQNFWWRTCPTLSLRRVHRLHALYNRHSLICFVNSYIVILFVYMHENMLKRDCQCSGACHVAPKLLGCHVDFGSVMPFEVENHLSLQLWQDTCYSNTHNLDEEVTSHQKVMQFLLPEVCVRQLNCTRQTTQLFGFSHVRECRPPSQQSIARWLHFKNIQLSRKGQSYQLH
jgi:hypothetical protein